MRVDKSRSGGLPKIDCGRSEMPFNTRLPAIRVATRPPFGGSTAEPLVERRFALVHRRHVAERRNGALSASGVCARNDATAMLQMHSTTGSVNSTGRTLH